MVDIDPQLTGGCACGKVNYNIYTNKIFGVGNCHCSTCRKSSGAPYVTAAFIPAKAMIVIGESNMFQTTTASGNIMNRYFCGKCGSHLYGQSTATDLIRPVLVASLDYKYRKDLEPDFDFWWSEALDSTPINKEIYTFASQFTHFPPKGGTDD